MTNTSTSSTRSFPKWVILGAIGVVILLIIISFIGGYNGMVKKRNAVDQAFSGVDAELQRQFNLIPNVVASVKGGQAQEQAIITQITNARTQYFNAKDADGKVAAGSQLVTAVNGLQAISEQYPDLKSNELVQNLITELEGSQNRITQTRRQYNAAVTDYNNAIETFPRNLTAGAFGFDKRTVFQADPQAQSTTPSVDLGSPTTSTTAAK